MAWVLETGIPILVARITVKAAPMATETAKIGSETMLSGTSPRPEKLLTKLTAKIIAAKDPRKVVIVAQMIAIL